MYLARQMDIIGLHINLSNREQNLNTNETLRRLDMDGFCILEGVISGDAVDSVREEVEGAVSAHQQVNEQMQANVRARGHRIGASGVAALGGLINHVPGFGRYLADRRILEPCESIFGPYTRVSSVGAVMNHPGNARGYWHSDWPFNQTVATHIPAPYPNAVMHITAIFMLSPFTEETGGTLVVPGSHRSPENPSGETDVDRDSPYPTEISAIGGAGSVLLFDSRLWHSVATNHGDRPRTAVIARYAPWWLNLSVQRPGTPDHTQIIVETGGKPSEAPLVKREVFDDLPEEAKTLFRHWVEE